MTDFLENHAVKMNHSDFKDSVNELERLVEADVSENELQKHLEIYPYILSQQFSHCHHVFPKVALGSQYETDFMCLDIPSSGKEWIGVELESTQKKVITKTGRKRADLEHAIQQIRDWRGWITDNLSYARQSKERNGLGLVDISPRFYGYVIIGRRKNYNIKFNELRRQLMRDELITIRSWDGIVEWARKRAKIFSKFSDALNLIIKQQDLIKGKDELYQLKTLITEYEHNEKLLEQTNQNITILREQYMSELSKVRPKLPEILIEKISALLKEDFPASNIIKQINDDIPEDIPAWILEEYILKFMMKDY